MGRVSRSTLTKAPQSFSATRRRCYYLQSALQRSARSSDGRSTSWEGANNSPRSLMHKFHRIFVVGSFTKWVIGPCATICAFTPARVDAQGAPQADATHALVRVPLAGFHVTTPDMTIVETSPFTWDNDSPSAKRHVLVGAGVGAAAGTVLGLILVGQGEVGYLSPRLLVGIPLLTGAGTGALVGYLVYLSKR